MYSFNINYKNETRKITWKHIYSSYSTLIKKEEFYDGTKKCITKMSKRNSKARRTKKKFLEKLKYKFQIIKFQYISTSNFDII